MEVKKSKSIITKRSAILFSTIILLVSFSLLFFVSQTLALETQYPSVPNAPTPGEKTSFPDYVKYLINFIIIASGLIALGSLIWGGLKYLTSQGIPDKISEARRRIIYGFLGTIIILSINIILGAVNPELTIVKLPFLEKTRIYAPSWVSNLKPGQKAIVAYEIPLGKLMDGFAIPDKYLFDGVPDSNAQFLKANINQAEARGYKDLLGSAFDGNIKNVTDFSDKTSALNEDDFDKLKIFLDNIHNKASSSTDVKIKAVKKAAEEVATSTNGCIIVKVEEYNKLIDQFEKEGKLNSSDPQIQAEVKAAILGLDELSNWLNNLNNSISQFENKKIPTLDEIINDLNLEKLMEEAEKTGQLFPEVNFIGDLTIKDVAKNFATSLDENYEDSTAGLVNNIASTTEEMVNNLEHPEDPEGRMTICIVGDDISGSQGEPNKKILEQRIAELKNISGKFQTGYLTRKEIWEIRKKNIDESIHLKQELDKNRELAQSNLDKNGSDYIYEGAVADTRLARILDLNEKVRAKSQQLNIIALTMNSAAALITALVPICNPAFCFLTGDPCAPVRPILIAAQMTLLSGAASLPILSSQLQKRVNELKEEREKLKNSVDEMTEGLEKAEIMIKSCYGILGSYEYTLLSLNNFLNYKAEVENAGFKVKIVRPWPEIEIKDDSQTFYCVREEITGPPPEEKYISPFGTKKILCEREIRVGESVDKTEYITKLILNNTDRTLKKAQEIINQASKVTPKLEGQDEAENTSKLGLPNGSEAERYERDRICNQFGQMLSKKIVDESFRAVPEKYAKRLTEHIIEHTGSLVASFKSIWEESINSMKGKDLKDLLNTYFDSLKNEAKAKISQSLFEVMPNSDIRKAVQSTIEATDGEKMKEIWQETFERMGQEGRRQFFNNLSQKLSQKSLRDIFKTIPNSLPSSESKILLKEILKNSPDYIINNLLKDYPGNTLDEKLSQIDNLPKDKLIEISNQAWDMLYDNGKIREIIQKVPADSLERTINNLPSSELKIFMNNLFEKIPDYAIEDFINFDILEYAPNFLQKTINNLPDEKVNQILNNEFFEPIKEDDLKEVLLKSVNFLPADPRKQLNTLIIRYIPNFSQIAEKTYDEFFKEAMDTLSKGGEIDVVDKINSYVKDTNEVIDKINKTLNLANVPLQELQKFQNKIRDFISDIQKQLPEEKLRKILSEKQRIEWYLNQANVNIRDIMNNVFVDYLPPESIKRTINDLLEYVPDEKYKKELNNILENIPDNQLPEKYREVLSKIPSSKINQAYQKIIYHIPDKNLSSLMNRITKDYLKNLPSKYLNDFLNDNLSYLSSGTKEIMGKFFSYLPEDTFNDIKSKVFVELDGGFFPFFPGNFFENYASYMPDELLEKLFKERLQSMVNKGLTAASKKFPQLNNNLSYVANLITGGSGLKQNGKKMARLPSEFTCATYPYMKVAKTFSYILVNYIKIKYDKNEVYDHTKQVDDMINYNIKGEIYTNLKNSRD